MNQPGLAGTMPSSHDNKKQLQAASARLRALRQERGRHLPRELVTGPGWDLLLDLHGERAVDAPDPLSPATRKRWLRVLEEHGLVRRDDEETGNPVLTEAGRAWIDGYLAACLAQGLL